MFNEEKTQGIKNVEKIYDIIKKNNELLMQLLKDNSKYILELEKENEQLRNEMHKLGKLVENKVNLTDIKNIEEFRGIEEVKNKIGSNNEDILIKTSGEVILDEEKQKEELKRVISLQHKPNNFWDKNAYARKQLLEDYEKCSTDSVMAKWNYKTKKSLIRVIKQVKAIEEREKQSKGAERVEIKPMDVSNIQYNLAGAKKGDCNLTINLRIFKANHGLGIMADDADGTKYWIEITGDTILFKDEFRRVVNEKIKGKKLSSIRMFYKPNKFNVPAWHIICKEEELKTAFDILYNTNPFGYEVYRNILLEVTDGIVYNLNMMENSFKKNNENYIVKVKGIERKLNKMEFNFYKVAKKYAGISLKKIVNSKH